MTYNWSAILVTSLMLAVLLATVFGYQFRSSTSGSPPFLRHVAAYFLAFVAGAAAVAALDRPWALVATTVFAALAIAVTVNGRRPLLAPGYARAVAGTFAFLCVFWGLRQLLLLVGIDLLAGDFVARVCDPVLQPDCPWKSPAVRPQP